MNIKFASRMDGVKGSAIREIFKLIGQKDMISFAGGLPSPDTFPDKALKEISGRLLTENPSLYLQYGVTEGYAPLIELLKERLSEKGIYKDDEELIIVSGAQQAIDLGAKAVLNPGDGVVCESPSFVGALNSFRTYEARLYGVPLNDDGIDIEILERTLIEHKNIKIIYVIPTFQNPSGITMSLEVRKRLLELCGKYDILIIEDNPYGELRYAGEEVPSLKSLDTEGRVLYCGTMSKTLSPGMRIGFALAPKALIEKMVVLKQVNDVHTNLLSQAIAYEWMKNYSYEEHVDMCCGLYKHKCELMLSEMDASFPDFVTYTRPQGGIFILGTIHKDIDSVDLLKKCVEKKVAFVPGNTFMTDIEQKSNCFRLNFSTMPDESITKGVGIMAETFKEI